MERQQKKINMVKVTAKIPEHILLVMKSESKRTGQGVQVLAGMLLTHGFNMIRQEQSKAQATEEVQDGHVHTED